MRIHELIDKLKEFHPQAEVVLHGPDGSEPVEVVYKEDFEFEPTGAGYCVYVSWTRMEHYQVEIKQS